ncbi:MAG TPA: nucleotide pyrophosphohydrolase [Edaphocola sp.]|nr:nucleotide pyrophosphohydrolase [Edaphocola sp.]
MSNNQEKMTIQQLQNDVDEWIRTIGGRYFNELTNLGILMEEVGELSKILVRKYGEQSFKSGENDQNLADEMADVLWVLVCLANQTGIDLEAAIKANFNKKTNRDRLRHKNNPKL